MPAIALTATEATLVKPPSPESLTSWVQLYGAIEAGANAENTIEAKRRDLKLFLYFFSEQVRSDHPEDGGE